MNPFDLYILSQYLEKLLQEYFPNHCSSGTDDKEDEESIEMQPFCSPSQ